ncbi:formimidoylglutamate deiminase [Vibrio sp. AK197]
MTRKVERQQFFAQRAWLSDAGWQSNVLLDVEDGHFTRIESNALPTPKATLLQGPVLSTIANVHSHSFQHLMAGLAEVSRNPNDSFWSWRDLMYKVVAKLTPDQVRIISTHLYIEMLKAGYTQVGEFHYLHHDRSGQAYFNPAEMVEQIYTSAQDSGIGLTLLPVLYSYSGFGGQPPSLGQQRFIHSVDSYLNLQQQSEERLSGSGKHNLGLCFHSLRAVTQHQIEQVMAAFPQRDVIHIHISEQQKEVRDCVDWCGQRPVEWLNRTIGLDSRWCLVHATHLNSSEIDAIAQSGAVVGLCPTTEANLGDGIFPAAAYQQKQGRWAIGSDSHVSLSIVDELRTLEYSQRLQQQQRNRLSRPEQPYVGDSLYQHALNGGNQACGVNLGIQVGARADFMTLDSSHPFIAASQAEDILNRWLFASNINLIRDVYVAAKAVISQGHHPNEEPIRQAFIRVIKEVVYDI